ncbi:MAG: hypothetical protein ABI654_16925 [Betaproteobacteria bacterium]
MKIIAAAATVVLAALSLPAFAQHSTPQIDQRQENQARRIEQGVRSGKLTPRETARLDRGQARIRQMEQQALADGRISRRERVAIDREQDKQNQLIARLSHNARGRN